MGDTLQVAEPPLQCTIRIRLQPIDDIHVGRFWPHRRDADDTLSVLIRKVVDTYEGILFFDELLRSGAFHG